jgi:outer membrane protein TolC
MRFSPRRTGISLFAMLFLSASTPGISSVAPSTSADGPKEALSLEDFLQKVLERNKAIQARLMAFHSARSLLRAENAFYEPALVSSSEYIDRQRANTIEIERSLRSGGFFVERNQNYSAAVEFRTPLNSRVRVGAGSRKLKNNIQRTVIVDLDAEYEANVGVSIEQPLLKGAGPVAAFAGKRLALRNAEAAFQEYRRQMMQIVAEAEMAYWQLHFAQEEHRLSTESVTVAQTVADDSRARFDAGRGSRLDVLEADAGLAVRKSRQSEARQKWVDALNKLASYFATSVQKSGIEYVATDAPISSDVDLSFQNTARTAFAMSPDRLRARAVVEQEKIRVGYARNQRLPQVDLKASFGASGLGYDYATAWRDVEGGRFPAWTISLEMRVPLFGGIRERNELRAARQRQRQAELNSEDVETQLSSGLDSAQQRVESSLVAARNYESVVEFRDNLLETQIQSAQVGRTDARTVLEAEQELFAARLGQLQSEIEHQRALLELQIIAGNLLKVRDIEIGMNELEEESWDWAKEGGESLNLLDYTPPTVDAISSVEFDTFEPEQEKPYKRPWHFYPRHKR